MRFQSAAITFIAALATTPLHAQRTPPAPAVHDSLALELRSIAEDPQGLTLSPLDSITVGDRRVEAGSTVVGSAVVARGDLNVFGRVEGNAVAIDGHVILHPGSYV